MLDLEGHLSRLDGRTIEGLQLERTPHGVKAHTTGDRTQEVRAAVRGDELVLTSIVAAKRVVPEKPKQRVRFVRRLWEINAHTDLVGFGLDGYGRVVGTCRHPLATLDPEELDVYLVALVRECDRLEWVLTGEDRW